MTTPFTSQQVKAILDDRKAEDIKIINVRELTSVCDEIIIATGTSTQHVRALAEYVVEDAKKAGVEVLGVEGLDHREWVLVDLGSLIVHVMLAEARSYYELEKLWFSDTE